MKKTGLLLFSLLITLSVLSQSAKKLMEQGIELNEEGKYEEGTRLLTKSINKNPKFADAFLYRGWCYYNTEQYKAAIADFNKAIYMNTIYSPWAYLGLGLTYQAQEQYKLAKRCYTKAIEKNNDYQAAYYYRSIAEIGIEDYISALKDINKSIELDPNYTDNYNIRRLLHTENGDYEKAEIDLNTYINLDPTADAYLKRADFYMLTGQLQKAEEDINKAITLNRGSAFAKFQKANLLMKQRKFQNSINIYLEVLNQKDITDDGKNICLYYVSVNYSYLKNYSEALNYINKAIELAPNNTHYWSLKGRIYYSGFYNTKDANDCFNKVIEIYNNNNNKLENDNTLAYTYYFLGDTEKAFQIATESISNNPEFEDYYTLACLYALSNNTHKAIYYIDQAIENGLKDYTRILNDYDLDNIKFKREFSELLKKHNIPNTLTNIDLVQSYVQAAVQNWQQRGKYEKTSEYLARVTQKKRDEFVKKATHQGIQQVGRLRMKMNIEKADYFPDEEAFKISLTNFDEVLVQVPNDEAEAFDLNIDRLRLFPTYALNSKNEFVINSLRIKNPYNNKEYEINKNLDIESGNSNLVLNFAPIEVEINRQKTDKKSIKKQPTKSINSDIDINIPKGNIRKAHTFALVIGNEDYSTYQLDLNTEIDVDFAKRDATLFQKYLVQTLGVPEKNITLLLNGTSGQINQAIHKLVNLAKVYDGEAELIFYYAGHGLPHEKTHESYLMPVDISGYTIEYGINLNDLYKQLSQYPIKRALVFIDACFSGAARNKSLVAMRGVKIKPKEYAVKDRMVVFTSSSGTQSSMGYTEKGHGFFTYFLLKQIQKSKGNLSLWELGHSVSQEVKRNSVLIMNKEQTPQLLSNPRTKEELLKTNLLKL